MADTIKFKRGVKSKLNTLAYGEPAYISDENELYIGTEDGVEKITRNKEVAELSSQLEHIVHEKNNEFFNLNNFKKLDGDIDDTDRIQRALDYCVENNLTLLIPHGEYIMSQRGTCTLKFGNSTRGYCVYKEGVKINVLQLGTIKFDLSNANIRPNVFMFVNCEVSWNGGIFEGVNNTGNKLLYGGNSIILSECSNSKINNVKTYKTNGGPLLMNCTHSSINDCYFENTTLNMGCCGAGFGIYSGNDNEIFRCVSYGSTGDGDISLYGTGERNRVTNCKCWSSLHDGVIVNTGAQGICVDAGQSQAVVSECYVYGYYYGIDVKTNINNALIINNVAERCKVSYASRWGEAGGIVVKVTFRGNTVLNPYNGRDNIIDNNSYWLGFMITHTGCVDIHNNVIIKTPGVAISEKGTGISITGNYNSNYAYIKEYSILGNTFNEQTSIASSTNSLIMDDIYINLNYPQNDINIVNNTFSGGYGTKSNSQFMKIAQARTVNISGNIFGRIDYKDDGAVSIANTSVVNFNNNITRDCLGFITCNSTKTLNIVGNVFCNCGDWKALVSGNVTGACNFSNNTYNASGSNTGTLVVITGGKKLISTNNILYMNRTSRNEFVLDGEITNVINTNNYIEHTS